MDSEGEMESGDDTAQSAHQTSSEEGKSKLCPCGHRSLPFNAPSGKVNTALTVMMILGFILLVIIFVPMPKKTKTLSSSANETFVLGNWTALAERTSSRQNWLALFVVFVSCSAAGQLAQLLRCPELLGMLVMGVCLRQIPWLNQWTRLSGVWSRTCRQLAFVVILLQGGLGLRPQSLRRLSCVVFRLAFLPCVVEAFTVAFFAFFILGFPPLYGLLLGFALGAVSPAVCVPSMLSLQSEQLGVGQGIPTLVMAASSTDDVLAIAMFSLLLSITFSQGDLLLALVRGPLDIIFGVLFGISFGVFLWYFPEPSSSYGGVLRSVCLVAGGVCAMLVSTACGLGGFGAPACLVSALVANFRWHLLPAQFYAPVEAFLNALWFVFQPFLFGLLGAELSLEAGLDLASIARGVLVLALGLLTRSVAAFLAVSWAEFRIQEKFFVAVAWLPKATVQAALGPVVYDMALATDSSPDTLRYGAQILEIAVVSILLTAPVGALLIGFTGRRFLKKENVAEDSSVHHPLQSAEQD